MIGLKISLLFCVVIALSHIDVEGFIKLGQIDQGGTRFNLHLIDTNKALVNRFYSWNYNVTLNFKNSSHYTIEQSELYIGGPNWKLINSTSTSFEYLSYVEVNVNNNKWAVFTVPDGYLIPNDTEYLGQFKEVRKEVEGHVFVSRADREFYLPGFTFIGETVPDTFFWLDTEVAATTNGWIAGRSGIFTKMQSYDNIDFKVTLPAGYYDVNYFRSLTVWCRAAGVSFGYVEIPQTNYSDAFFCDESGPISYPRDDQPVIHLLSGNAYVTGPRSITFKYFEFIIAPATWFWLGPETSGNSSNLTDGMIITDEKETLYRLGNYSNVTIAIKLPSSYSLCTPVFFLSVYCVDFAVNFGHSINSDYNCTGCPAALLTQSSKPALPWYCLTLSNTSDANVRVEYQVDEKNNEVNFRLYACNLQEDQYVAFGLSGSSSGISMVGGDVCVCRMDSILGKPVCDDHKLTSRSQCATDGSSYSGACPDTFLGGTNDCTKVSVYREDGSTTFGFTRKINTTNDVYDADIELGIWQYLIWAKGNTFPQSQNDRFVLKHAVNERASGAYPIRLDFNGSTNTCEDRYSCTPTQLEGDPWSRDYVCGNDLQNNRIRAVIGPSGPQNRGYDAITDQSGWGISWYLNGQLIPEVYLKRGETYTFDVNGGLPTNPLAAYHPFYLTNSSAGGIKSRAVIGEDISDEEVYAGLQVSQGTVSNLTDGSLCEYKLVPGSNQDVSTFDEFSKQFEDFSCDYTMGFDFTPDENTPDEIYYQCATHRLLGWKIYIVDAYDAAKCPTPTSPAIQIAQTNIITMLAMLVAVLMLMI